MSSPAQLWYYVDAQGQQQGPVSQPVILGHARQGLLIDSSLLWRDGLTEWQPLSSLRAELGLAAPSIPAATAPPAARGAAAAQAAASSPVSPYAAPSAALGRQVAWSATAESDIVYAGFLRRWAALFLDTMILVAVFYIFFFALMILFAGLNIALPGGDRMLTQGGALVALGVYPVWFGMAGLYYALMESSAKQATLGKMAMGIKVTDGAGARLGFARALGRWFSASLSYLTVYVGFLMAGFTERKRALHDFVAGTLVVDRWAFTEHPQRQKRELGGCLIAFLVVMGLMIVIAVLSMFAAVTLPAYQDFTERARRGAALQNSLPFETTVSVCSARTLPGPGRWVLTTLA
jgi:uncharacterized RDD family membrane protein YckC